MNLQQKEQIEWQRKVIREEYGVKSDEKVKK